MKKQKAGHKMDFLKLRIAIDLVGVMFKCFESGARGGGKFKILFMV